MVKKMVMTAILNDKVVMSTEFDDKDLNTEFICRSCGKPIYLWRIPKNSKFMQFGHKTVCNRYTQCKENAEYNKNT